MGLIVMLLALTLYVGGLALLLRLAARIVLRCTPPWGNVFKVVLINFLALLAVQVGVMLLAGLFMGFGSLSPETVMARGSLLQGVMVLASVGVSSYVYSRWISCPGTDYEEGTTFWQGLGLYVVQILLAVVLAIAAALMFALIGSF